MPVFSWGMGTDCQTCFLCSVYCVNVNERISMIQLTWCDVVTAADQPHVFTVLVTVSDGVLRVSALVTVEVLDVDEPQVCQCLRSACECVAVTLTSARDCL